MRRDYHNWLSPRLERQMELLVFGHAGAPVLVFPTLGGRFYEYEDSGMVAVLTSKVDSGQRQLFCVDSIDHASWLNRSIHPHERVRRQAAYEEYILQEVMPLIRGLNASGPLTVTGCGLGGYQSVNLTLRHPDLVASCVSMSGSFEVKKFMDGYFDDDFYFNNPLDYLANLKDRSYLDRYAQIAPLLAVGDRDSCLGENRRLAQIFTNQKLAHSLEVWHGGEPDSWPLWRNMAAKFL